MQGDWLDAERKIKEGKEYTTTANITLGDTTVELGFRLPSEQEFIDFNADIEQKKLKEHRDSDDGDVTERLLELQEQDELSEEEEREMKELAAQLQEQQSDIMSSMGKPTFHAFMDIGQAVIEPTDGDITDAFDLDPSEQDEKFGSIPNTRRQMKSLLTEYMRGMIDEQPYPIKFQLGQQAVSEYKDLVGNPQSGDD